MAITTESKYQVCLCKVPIQSEHKANNLLDTLLTSPLAIVTDIMPLVAPGRMPVPTASIAPTLSTRLPTHAWQTTTNSTTDRPDTRMSAELAQVGLVVVCTIGGAWWLHKHRYNNGLLLGAGAAGAILLQIKSDERVSLTLVIAVGAAYATFHATYCKRITASLRYGEGFVALTIIMAGITAIFLLQIPVLATAWNNSDGASIAAFVITLHLLAMFLGSVGVKTTRRFFKSRESLGDALPVFQLRHDNVATTSRENEFLVQRPQFATSSRSRSAL